MKYAFLTTAFLILLCSCSRNFYVVRHAEKAPADGSMNSSNPPLSPAGQQRALVLRDSLLPKGIQQIYSTNTIRTRSTAGPLGEALGIAPVLYKNDSLQFLMRTLIHSKKNTLIVGHSNTVDDVVKWLMQGRNMFSDLPETAYDRLFRVRVNYGLFRKKHVFKEMRYGTPTPP